MKTEFEPLELVRNDENSRFELTVDGFTAFIDFKVKGDAIALIHTESPEDLADRGVATALVEKTLIYLKNNNLQLIPLCPLVFAFVKRHPDWINIVKEDYKAKFDTI